MAHDEEDPPMKTLLLHADEDPPRGVQPAAEAPALVAVQGGAMESYRWRVDSRNQAAGGGFEKRIKN